MMPPGARGGGARNLTADAAAGGIAPAVAWPAAALPRPVTGRAPDDLLGGERTVSGEPGDGGEALRRRGHRLTPQRQMVLRALEQAGRHLSAEEICQQVQAAYPGMSLSTVYRTLELLERLGLVLEARLGGESRVYELAGDQGEHTHLICRSCGAVGHPRDGDLRPLLERLAVETGYRDISLHVVATGVCPGCATRAARASQAATAAPQAP
jgi:Fe2+ or Zn2+ uptake regulation protein